MKNRISPYVTPIFFVLLTFVMLMTGSSIAIAGQDDAAIDQVRLDFNAAFNEGNASAMAQLIDRDAVWMPPGMATIVGKDDIVALYAKTFAKVRSKFEMKPGKIQLCGDWAFMHGTFSRADTLKAGGTVKKVSGHYLFVLKKQPDGAWKIARDIWNGPVKR